MRGLTSRENTIAALRTIFAPPPYEETISERTWRDASMFRLVVLLICLAVDLTFLILFPENSVFNRDVARLAFGTASALVLVDIVYTVLALTGRTRSLAVFHVFVVLEMLGNSAMIHVTGSLHSVLLLLSIGCMVFYRIHFGWRTAVISIVVLGGCHMATIILELAGVLDPVPILSGNLPAVYLGGPVMVFAITVTLFIYLIGFFGANAIVNLLRAKDRALADVRAEVARLAEDVEPGRLTGSLVAARYAIGELIGRGGMGEIYRARDVPSDTWVAVKILHGRHCRDIEMLQRFRREAELAAVLEPDATAQILDVGIDYERDLHFISMQYLEGEDLGHALRRLGKLEADDVVALGRAIARVLDSAHAAGIVHRDIKPQNIFVLASEPEWDLRLLDFGIARLLDGDGSDAGATLTVGRIILGSPGYMSPEQATGKTHEAGPAADRFSLAAILYRALTGETPFGDHESAIEYVSRVATSAPTSVADHRPDLPAAVDAVFVRALAKEPELRHESATELVNDLEAALAPAATVLSAS